MKVLVKFNQEYFQPVLDGSKTQTMRMAHKRLDVKADDEVIAIFPDGQELPLKITDTGYKAFKSINDEDAEREGFSSALELKNVLREIYKDFGVEDYNRFYYYRFKLIDENKTVELCDNDEHVQDLLFGRL